MRLPLVDPRNPKSIDIDHFKRMVDVFMDRGFNYFDTAYTYHQSKSEAAFRQAVGLYDTCLLESFRPLPPDA